MHQEAGMFRSRSIGMHILRGAASMALLLFAWQLGSAGPADVLATI